MLPRQSADEPMGERVRPAPPGRAAGTRHDAGGHEVRLHLLGGFELVVGGRPLELPRGPQRVLAFLALSDPPQSRQLVAGTLWPESPDPRSRANLRTALWKLGSRRDMVESQGENLRLHPDVEVDVHENTALARRLLDPATEGRPEELSPARFGADLLPDWCEEWLTIEQQRYLVLRIRALEAMSRRLLDLGRLGETMEAALLAVSAEPLRESAHRAVIRGLLAEGNRGEATRHYELFRSRIRDEIGLEPSFDLREVESEVRGIIAA